jgi:hypothetical protein
MTRGGRAVRLYGRRPGYESKVQPYSHDEYQELMTAVRHDIRVARDRIYEGRELSLHAAVANLACPTAGTISRRPDACWTSLTGLATCPDA